MEKVQIFIDAGNFYHMVLRKLGCREVDFDFDKLANFLAGENRTITDEGKRFYIGTVREGHESKEAMSNQTALFSGLLKSKWEMKPPRANARGIP